MNSPDTPQPQLPAALRLACPVCRNDVVQMPLPDGATALVEPTTHQVDDTTADYYVLVPYPPEQTVEGAGSKPALALRRHQCPGPPEALPSRRMYVGPPTRTELIAVRNALNAMELYRAQTTGRLRKHPGQRTYSPVDVTARLVDVGRWSASACPLCRGTHDRNDARPTMPVATVTVVSGDAYVLRACTPECNAFTAGEANSDVDGI